MADLSKLELTNSTIVTIKDNSQALSDHRHHDSDLVPIAHKVYESTSYYGTANDWDNATWYFMSVRPDDWNKPWRVKIKLHSYCPGYATYQSYTWATLFGRANDWSYVNYNERNYRAHNYVAIYRLKKVGFDAGYGNAIGVSIYNSDNPTNSAYYRTFEVDYYDCENCTVALLDTPVKWADWSGGSTTNYESLTYSDASTRGLCETNDANDGRYYTERLYSSSKAGSNNVYPYTLIMRTADDTWESFVLSGTTAIGKTKNPHGFMLGQIFYFSGSSTITSGTVIGNYTMFESYGQLIDHRYSFNTENNATNGLTANLTIYLIGTLSADGLFYLANKWWGQELPNTEDGKLYIQLGTAYDRYRMVLDNKHPIYHYVNGAVREFIPDAATVNGHTVESDVPSGAAFTDTTYSLSNSGENVTLTPSTGSAQSISLSTLINGLSEGTSQAQGDDYLIAQYAGGGTTTTSYHRKKVSKVVNGTVVKAALGTGSGTTKYLREDGTWQVPTGTTYSAGTGISISGTTISAKDAELSPYEEKLQWGGGFRNSSVSPVGMAVSSEHSANRLAFINPAALTYEYSSDAGATWTNYNIADSNKPKFCTEGWNWSLAIGRPDMTTDITVDSRTRVTISANDRENRYLYTSPKKLLIFVSSPKPISMLVERRTGANYLNDGAWVTVNTYSLTGWSGWNDIPINDVPNLGGGLTQTGNNWQLRLTFSVPEPDPTRLTTGAVQAIRLYGDNDWLLQNNLAKTGHLYSFDMTQSATFPADVKATGNMKMQNGKQVTYLSATPTSGQILTADGTAGGVKTTGYTIAKSVPSNAVFTDTTYTFAGGTNKITVTPSGGTASDVTFTASDDTRVLKAGDTMTGDLIAVRGTDSQRKIGFLNDSDKYGGLKLNNSGNNIDFGWDYDQVAGAGAYFRAASYGSGTNQGQFGFYARSSAGTVQLVGTTGGALTWNNRKVVTATNNTQIGSATKPVYVNGSGYVTECTYTVEADVPSGAEFTDTKNTAGSTDTSSKIYLIGATSQAANPQTYSDDEVYVTSGVVTTKSVQVGGGAATMQFNSTTNAIDFIFT